MTILLSSHSLSEIDFITSNILFLKDGEAYSINGLQGGLREIKDDQEKGITFLSSNLMVLNNYTQQWEKLSDIPFE